SEHAIDSYQINWHRLGHYILCTWICLIFTQSIGQLVGVAIMEPYEIAMLLSTILFAFVIMLDDFFFKTEELKRQFFVHASNIVQMKYVTRYLIYIFYGLDRCDPDREFSWVMAKNYSDSNQIWHYITRLLTSSLVIRIITLV